MLHNIIKNTPERNTLFKFETNWEFSALLGLVSIDSSDEYLFFNQNETGGDENAGFEGLL